MPPPTDDAGDSNRNEERITLWHAASADEAIEKGRRPDAGRRRCSSACGGLVRAPTPLLWTVAGVEVELHHVPGTIHGYDGLPIPAHVIATAHDSQRDFLTRTPARAALTEGRVDG